MTITPKDYLRGLLQINAYRVAWSGPDGKTLDPARVRAWLVRDIWGDAFARAFIEFSSVSPLHAMTSGNGLSQLQNFTSALAASAASAGLMGRTRALDNLAKDGVPRVSPWFINSDDPARRGYFRGQIFGRYAGTTDLFAATPAGLIPLDPAFKGVEDFYKTGGYYDKIARPNKFYTNVEILLMPYIDVIKLYYSLAQYTAPQPVEGVEIKRHPASDPLTKGPAEIYQRWLQNRLYSLRADLRTVRQPDGTLVPGLVPLSRQPRPPRVKEKADMGLEIVEDVVGYLIPFVGWALTIYKFVEEAMAMIEASRQRAQQLAQANALVGNVIGGVSAIAKYSHAEFLDGAGAFFIGYSYAEALNFPTSPLTRALAAQVGLPHPAMAVRHDVPWTPPDEAKRQADIVALQLRLAGTTAASAQAALRHQIQTAQAALVNLHTDRQTARAAALRAAGLPDGVSAGPGAQETALRTIIARADFNRRLREQRAWEQKYFGDNGGTGLLLATGICPTTGVSGPLLVVRKRGAEFFTVPVGHGQGEKPAREVLGDFPVSLYAGAYPEVTPTQTVAWADDFTADVRQPPTPLWYAYGAPDTLTLSVEANGNNGMMVVLPAGGADEVMAPPIPLATGGGPLTVGDMTPTTSPATAALIAGAAYLLLA